MSRSLIVLPDDTSKPILDAIAQATKSIRVKMFFFSDPSLLNAVIEPIVVASMSASCLTLSDVMAKKRTTIRARGSPKAASTLSTAIPAST